MRSLTVALAMLNSQSREIVNKLNPFSGPGSLAAEQQKDRREQFKVMVWAVLGANAVLVAGLLIQGCRGEPAPGENAGGNAAEVTASDTNGTAVAQQKPGADLPVPPTLESAPTNTQVSNDTVAAPVAPLPPAPAPAAAKQYAVVKGDSFYKIAKASGVSQKALANANPGVDSAKLKVGQVLQLPTGAEPGSTVSTAASVPADGIASPSTSTPSKAATHYVVKSGDSLRRIARAHGTTVQAIKVANGLTSDSIVAGQSLKLPGSRTAGTSSSRG
jgi:LysM repeat protein